jgi:hypothetical protein
VNYSRTCLCWGGPLDGQWATGKGERLEVVEQPELSSIDDYSVTAIAPNVIVYRLQRLQVVIQGIVKRTWYVWIQPGDHTSEDLVVGGMILVGLLSEGGWR